jgi:hypothetical protein
VLQGTVIDRETLFPLQSAEVTVRWTSNQRGRASERNADTDLDGRFRICDLPRDTHLTLQATFFNEPSESRGVTLTAEESEPQVLHISAPHSKVTGSVIEHDTRRPVAAAAVRLANAGAPRITTGDGAFLFEKVPPGTFSIEVQHVGYTTVRDSIDVEYMSTITATIRVAATVIPLAPLEISVRKAALERVGFYTRQERSAGTFLTREDIQDMHPLYGSDVMRRVSGVRVERGRFGNVVLGRGGCPFRFVMDGTRIGSGFSLDDIPPDAFEAIEVYMGAAEVPIEFQGFSSDVNGNCGVIVIWTRRRG